RARSRHRGGQAAREDPGRERRGSGGLSSEALGLRIVVEGLQDRRQRARRRAARTRATRGGHGAGPVPAVPAKRGARTHAESLPALNPEPETSNLRFGGGFEGEEGAKGWEGSVPRGSRGSEVRRSVHGFGGSQVGSWVRSNPNPPHRTPRPLRPFLSSEPTP